ncbi:MAG: DUF2182 domain-containing protein [Pseudomonadota bacterium]
MTRGVEAALRRHRLIAIAALAILSLLGWAWLITGAGMGMDLLVSLSPPSPPAPAMGMGGEMQMSNWSVGHLAMVFSMWWVMMVAMMLPSAAPTILLFAINPASRLPASKHATACFLAGYLLAWAGFSLLAAVLQVYLEMAGYLVPGQTAIEGRWYWAAILAFAGIYQLTPLKSACLSHCRNPASFLSRHYRPGAGGALRMGVFHGSFCVGCCWLLMLLLFVFGVMNLAWIALLTLLVAGEKLLPFGHLLAKASGAGFLAAAILIAVG